MGSQEHINHTLSPFQVLHYMVNLLNPINMISVRFLFEAVPGTVIAHDVDPHVDQLFPTCNACNRRNASHTHTHTQVFLLPSKRPAITNDRSDETQLKLQTTDKERWGTQRTPAVRPCINDNELIKLICAG